MKTQNLCFVLLLLTVIILSTSFSYVIAQESNIIELIPIDDSFVSADLSDPNDLQEFRKLNWGNLDYLRIGYVLNTTETPKAIISVALLKFDLSDISEDQIDSAELQLYADQIKLSIPQEIGVYLVNNSRWSESTITYDTSPSFSDLISTVTINASDSYRWELGDMIKQNAGKQLSLMISFVDLLLNTEQVIIFASKDLQNTELSPTLIITTEDSESQTEDSESQTEGGGCLIATATFGSELSPQIQQLRELRDNTVLQTNSGSAFMESFNEFYYSFSPYIADYERENPVFKEMVKIGITPMISSLSILNYVDMDSEELVLGYGIGVILLNIGMYFVAPAIVIVKLGKRNSRCS